MERLIEEIMNWVFEQRDKIIAERYNENKIFQNTAKLTLLNELMEIISNSQKTEIKTLREELEVENFRIK